MDTADFTPPFDFPKSARESSNLSMLSETSAPSGNLGCCRLLIRHTVQHVQTPVPKTTLRQPWGLVVQALETKILVPKFNLVVKLQVTLTQIATPVAVVPPTITDGVQAVCSGLAERKLDGQKRDWECAQAASFEHNGTNDHTQKNDALATTLHSLHLRCWNSLSFSHSC